MFSGIRNLFTHIAPVAASKNMGQAAGKSTPLVQPAADLAPAYRPENRSLQQALHRQWLQSGSPGRSRLHESREKALLYVKRARAFPASSIIRSGFGAALSFVMRSPTDGFKYRFSYSLFRRSHGTAPEAPTAGEAGLRKSVPEIHDECLEERQAHAAVPENPKSTVPAADEVDSEELDAAIKASRASYEEEQKRRFADGDEDAELAAASLGTKAPGETIRVNHGAGAAYEKIKDDALAFFKEEGRPTSEGNEHAGRDHSAKVVETPQGTLHEMNDEVRDRFMSDIAENNRKTRRYFERNGLDIVPTSDAGNNCLPRALFKIATGETEGDHDEACARLRKKLNIPEGQMLHPSLDDPLYRRMVDEINKECGTSMDVHVAVSGPNGLPVFVEQREEGKGTGKHPVVLWNDGAHFQPVIAR